MNNNYTDIKEISLVSKCMEEDNKYEDLLRISKSWKSYRKINLSSDKSTISWSYKTEFKTFERDFERLCDVCYHLFNVSHKKLDIDTPYSFNVRVTYKDNTHIDLSFNGTFADNNLFDYLIGFIKVIPEGERYPEVFTVFKNVYLTKEVLRTIDKTKIDGLMFAEDCAMGKPGCIELITKAHFRYYTDGIYGRRTDVNQDDVTALLDGFKFEPSFIKPILNYLSINNENWIYLNLGQGNHLLLSYDLFSRIGSLLIDSDYSNMYVKWRRLVGDYE